MVIPILISLVMMINNNYNNIKKNTIDNNKSPLSSIHSLSILRIIYPQWFWLLETYALKKSAYLVPHEFRAILFTRHRQAMYPVTIHSWPCIYDMQGKSVNPFTFHCHISIHSLYPIKIKWMQLYSVENSLLCWWQRLINILFKWIY